MDLQTHSTWVVLLPSHLVVISSSLLLPPHFFFILFLSPIERLWLQVSAFFTGTFLLFFPIFFFPFLFLDLGSPCSILFPLLRLPPPRLPPPLINRFFPFLCDHPLLSLAVWVLRFFFYLWFWISPQVVPTSDTAGGVDFRPFHFLPIVSTVWQRCLFLFVFAAPVALISLFIFLKDTSLYMNSPITFFSAFLEFGVPVARLLKQPFYQVLFCVPLPPGVNPQLDVSSRSRSTPKSSPVPFFFQRFTWSPSSSPWTITSMGSQPPSSCFFTSTQTRSKLFFVTSQGPSLSALFFFPLQGCLFVK